MNNNGHIKARRKLIEDGTSNNKIIGLGFFKKDGTFRTGAFRRGVGKGITGGGLKFNPKEHDLITLYDMNAKGYRNVPLDSVTFIKGLGKTWKIIPIVDEVDNNGILVKYEKVGYQIVEA